ncbi:MAG: hypothetical protein MZV63_58545 [Marinilabiliales bacterium]|nr:hypothetical protein [Marinilabiliales bacterium]
MKRTWPPSRTSPALSTSSAITGCGGGRQVPPRQGRGQAARGPGHGPSGFYDPKLLRGLHQAREGPPPVRSGPQRAGRFAPAARRPGDRTRLRDGGRRRAPGPGPYPGRGRGPGSPAARSNTCPSCSTTRATSGTSRLQGDGRARTARGRAVVFGASAALGPGDYTCRRRRPSRTRTRAWAPWARLKAAVRAPAAQGLRPWTPLLLAEEGRDRLGSKPRRARGPDDGAKWDEIYAYRPDQDSPPRGRARVTRRAPTSPGGRSLLRFPAPPRPTSRCPLRFIDAADPAGPFRRSPILAGKGRPSGRVPPWHQESPLGRPLAPAAHLPPLHQRRGPGFRGPRPGPARR